MIHMNHNAPSQLSNSRSQQDEMVDPTYRPLKVEASSAVCNAQCATVCQSEPSASSMGYWVSNAAEGEHHAAFIPMVKVNVCVNDHPDHNVVCQLRPESQSVESCKTKSVVAILDTGSDASFITRALVEELGLKGRNSRLQLGTLHGVNLVDSELIDLKIGSMIDASVFLNLRNLFVVDEIPANFSSWNNIDQFSHLQDLDLFRPKMGDQVDLLLGQDNGEVLVPLEVVQGDKDEPFAVRGILGWSVFGCSRFKGTPSPCVNSVTSFFVNFLQEPSCDVEYDDSLNRKLERFWEIEQSSSCSPQCGLSVDDKHVLALWQEQCEFHSFSSWGRVP
jgi:hypothetical protein